MATPIKKKTTKKTTAAPTVLYLYGISSPARTPVKVVAEAIDGSANITPVRIEGLDCWVSPVDRREFADHLSQNMENLDWLATVGVRHQRTLARLSAGLVIVPARFGTVFLTEESLCAHVQTEKKRIQSVLRKIAGADEWGIKVFRIATPAPAIVAAKSGTDYLKRKAQAVVSKPKQKDPQIAAFLTALSKSSIDKAPGGSASTGQPDLVWHGSFLVRRDRHPSFEAVLRKFTTRLAGGYRVECSGPWPPYSFVGQHG